MGAVLQSLVTRFTVSVVDLVAGLATYAELSTGRRHLLASKMRATKQSLSSIWLVSFQGIWRAIQMPKCVTYVPGIKRYLCVRKLNIAYTLRCNSQTPLFELRFSKDSALLD